MIKYFALFLILCTPFTQAVFADTLKPVSAYELNELNQHNTLSGNKVMTWEYAGYRWRAGVWPVQDSAGRTHPMFAYTVWTPEGYLVLWRYPAWFDDLNESESDFVFFLSEGFEAASAEYLISQGVDPKDFNLSNWQKIMTIVRTGKFEFGQLVFE